MNGFITLSSQALAFNDPTPNSDPQLKSIDWKPNHQALPCANAGRAPFGTLAAGQSVVVFDGTRSLTVDGTTAFSVTLSPLDAGTRYRFTWTGGTNPGFRTDRGLTLSTHTVTFTIGANQVADVTLGGGTFGATAVGDTVLVPGLSTGDSAGPFSALNEGVWVVIGALSSTHLQLARLVGSSFSGTSETQTVTANGQLVAFSAAGVQVGDSLTISAGFPITDQQTFTVDRVTSTWFEVISSLPLATVSGATPGAAGIQFYSTVKRWTRVEVDQQAVVQMNADVGMSNILQPIAPGDAQNMGWSERWGPVYKIVVINQSPSLMNFNVFSCE